MKKIKLIFATLLLVFLIPSCEKDGGNSKLEIQYGAVPNVQKIAGTDSSIDFDAVSKGENINLGFTVSVPIGEISSMDIVGFYTKVNGDFYKATLVSNVTTFPANFNISQTDLFNAFEELNSASDIELGDELTVTAQLKLKDGTIIKIINDDGTDNHSSYIGASNLYKVFQTYKVSCPITDASSYSGSYIVKVDKWLDYAIDGPVNVVYDPADGGNKFRILSDLNPSCANPGEWYILVTIDTADGSIIDAVTVGEEIYSLSPTADKYSVTAGTGSVGTCNGDINLIASWGTNGDAEFSLVKAN